MFDIPNRWRWVTVDDITAPEKYSCVGGPFGSNLTSKDYVDAPGVPVIRGQNMGDATRRFVDDEFVYVSAEKARRLRQNMAFPGDLVFTQRGTLGQVAWIPARTRFREYVVSQSQMKLTVDPAKADAGFVYAFFRSKAALEYIQRNTMATGVPHTNLGILRAFPIPLPPLPEQRRIATVLGAIDEKVELNRTMNQTLDEMARAIFEATFVDFGGCNDLVESEIGPIPAGWGTRSLFESATYINGAAYRDFDFTSDGTGTPVIKIAELKAGVTSTTKFTLKQMDPRYRIDDREMLFSWSGNPDTSIDTFIWSGGTAWLNQHIFKVLPHRADEWYFVFYLLRHLRPVFAETARDKQTTGLGHVTGGDLKRMRVVRPPAKALAAFNKVVSPIFNRWYSNTRSTRTLADLLDTILPRLTSGELSLPDAEAAIDEAGG